MAGLRSLDVSDGGSGVGIGPGRLMLIHTMVEHTALSRRHMIFPDQPNILELVTRRISSSLPLAGDHTR